MADSNTDNKQDNNSPRPPTLNPSLVRQLVLQQNDSNNNSSSKRLAKDAEAMAGELLRLFILEARERAGIEAECETDGNTNDHGKAMIRADHISKIAAELLMDFS